jgi:tetratricopeptide (TPR) repeat protein/transcriptional regulator with XRE-family HTH domain
MTDEAQRPAAVSTPAEQLTSAAGLAAEIHRHLVVYERLTGRRVKRVALAKSVGVSKSSLYGYLNGTKLPPTDVLDRLLDVLDVPPAERGRLSTGRDELDIRSKVSARPEPVEPPRELPMDVSGFTGRHGEIAELDRLCSLVGAGPAVVISAMVGPAGAGKTALAVHWAHRARGCFPDGQLYLDLRGYDPDRPVSPADALAGLLRSLGVAGAEIPSGLAERAGRYRSLLTGRRMLLLLDNAQCPDQVRDLLPGTPSCFVLVTSRDSLAGLVIGKSARRLELGLLPPADGAALVRTLLGERADAEPAAVDALVGCCAGLPLALRIAAEFAAARPAAALGDLAADLTADLRRHRLDRFGDSGDDRSAIAAVFSWSYRQLPGAAARAFRQLGLHPGADLDLPTAAALTGQDADSAEQVIEILRRGHLVEPTGPGRYRLHDLLRAYARELGRTEGRTADQHAARTRLYQHYLAMTTAATQSLYPGCRADQPAAEPLLDPATASGWLDAERGTLLAICATAVEHCPALAIQLAAALYRYLDADHNQHALAVHQYALRAATQTSDRVGEAHARTDLAAVLWRLGRYQAAADQLQRALPLSREAGDHAGTARALSNYGIVQEWQGRLGQAADCYRQALDLCRDLGDQVGTAHALTNLGDICNRLGEYERAGELHAEALIGYREMGDRAGEADTLNSLGLVHTRQRRPRLAVEHYQRALTIHRELGNRAGVAYVRVNLGDTQVAAGRYQAATGHYRDALAVFHEIGERYGAITALNGLGAAACGAGEHVDATASFTAALALAVETGNVEEQAKAYAGLGHAYRAADDPNLSQEHWRQAADLYARLNAPEAAEIRRQLAQP